MLNGTYFRLNPERVRLEIAVHFYNFVPLEDSTLAYCASLLRWKQLVIIYVPSVVHYCMKQRRAGQVSAQVSRVLATLQLIKMSYNCSEYKFPLKGCSPSQTHPSC